MQEKDVVPKHSVRGYLRRQSTEKLEEMRNYYLQEGVYENYSEVILEIIAVLEDRSVPDDESEWYAWAREKLLAYKKKD